jgi:hypothetical protein
MNLVVESFPFAVANSLACSVAPKTIGRQQCYSDSQLHPKVPCADAERNLRRGLSTSRIARDSGNIGSSDWNSGRAAGPISAILPAVKRRPLVPDVYDPARVLVGAAQFVAAGSNRQTPVCRRNIRCGHLAWSKRRADYTSTA